MAQNCLPFNHYAESIANLPEPVANNAVCAGQVGFSDYLYTFGGIDSTKAPSGIHLRSWRLNIDNWDNQWEAIPDLPDTAGKIASAASYLDGIVYIIGGYHVAMNGTEKSSRRVHRYDCASNTFLSDAADLPLAIDDHVQGVWRDSLIYVISGWSNTGNVSAVQIYDPDQDSWQIDFQTWDNAIYNSFGASGTILGDTIYYLGGARTGTNFPIQDYLRKGIINPNDASDITWSDTLLPGHGLYRAACLPVQEDAVDFKAPVWFGGSKVTYNFDGIAYNGSGGVQNADVIQYWDHDSLIVSDCQPTLMDHRGGATISGSSVFTVGGMDSNQMVSHETRHWNIVIPGLTQPKDKDELTIFPNPSKDGVFEIHGIQPNSIIEVFTLHGQKLMRYNAKAGHSKIDVSDHPASIFMVLIYSENTVQTKRLIYSQ